MTRWGTGIPCPKRCGGKIEAYEGETRGEYQFCCTHCDLQGDWEQFAKRRLAIRRGVR